MIAALLLQQPHGPVGHYAGGASSKTAGTTAFAGHFFRFLFSTVPQWVQMGGIFVGVPVALILAWQLWKHRQRVWAWWLARHRGIKVAMIAAAFVIAAGGATTGLAGYTYVMHDNDFCQSCHIMDTAWNRFQVSAHRNLQCHACHRQPLYVSTVELYYWVTERQMVVPVHDKVPTAVCSECHMQKGTDSTLTLVTLTAGHAVHLKSDSSALKNVECVTCHGRDFHVFVPNATTCTQSGCHMLTRVNLGAMSNQSFPHCTICHDFKGRVSLTATVKEAKQRLVPTGMNCFSCHRMTEKLATFDVMADPHKGNCGNCHDPHKQERPADAFKTCTNSGCHGSPDTLTAMHRGLPGHSLASCGDCHQAHTWKVNGTNCVSCHKTIMQDQPLVRRPPSLVKPTSNRRSFRRRRVAPVLRLASFRQTVGRTIEARQLDTTFLHSKHVGIACTDCHGTTSSHGGLKFSRPAGCLACHHGASQRTQRTQRTQCVTCHVPVTLGVFPRAMTFAISARREPVTRTISFAHSRHARLACTSCHSTSDVKRAVTTACASCHENHHTPAADCSTCHTTARQGHDRAAHEGCARCHTDPTVAALPANRNVCLVCHDQQRDHYPNGDCATCHAIARDMLHAGLAGRGR